jgi:2-amino-4-hydroxy-6-hydroxymethyldihydropteridine diphosphokinase
MNEVNQKKLILGLGSNLGNRYCYLYESLLELGAEFNTTLTISKCYESLPWGKTDQPNFMNCVAFLHTLLKPEACFSIVKSVEQSIGRVRNEVWGPRCIDIDILFYDGVVLNNKTLEIPHPRITERDFVLHPLNEICPEFSHPVLNKTIGELSVNLENNLSEFACF